MYLRRILIVSAVTKVALMNFRHPLNFAAVFRQPHYLRASDPLCEIYFHIKVILFSSTLVGSYVTLN